MRCPSHKAYPTSIASRPGRSKPSRSPWEAWGAGVLLRALQAALLGLWVWLGGAGCARDVGDVHLLLVRSPVVQEEPLNPDVVKWLGLRVEGPGLGVRTLEEPYVQGATSRLPRVEIGPDRIFLVEGRVSEGGAVVSRGESVPLTLSRGRTEIELFIGLAGRFSSSGGGTLLEPRGEAVLFPVAPGQLLFLGGREAPGGNLLGAVEAFDATRGK